MKKLKAFVTFVFSEYDYCFDEGGCIDPDIVDFADNASRFLLKHKGFFDKPTECKGR